VAHSNAGQTVNPKDAGIMILQNINNYLLNFMAQNLQKLESSKIKITAMTTRLFFFVTEHQWLQFDLGPATQVTGILTKGRADTKRRQWITSYTVSYSNDSVVWFVYTDGNHLGTKVRPQCQSVSQSVP
jgi:hypothetical protein